jgi:putative acetyltransferase
VLIRRARPADLRLIGEIHAAAFGRDAEKDLAIALLTDGSAIAELSLVVEHEGRPFGHVVCSRGALEGTPVAGLGPIGILPAHQTMGAGTALMHAVIGAADAFGEPLIALLGSPAYYSRFGFVTSTEVGIEAPDPSWGVHFQVRTLSGFDPATVGRFTYAAAFDVL